MRKSIHSVLRGRFLVSDDSFKNWKMILFISVLAIVMIASSHSADKKVYKIARLKNEAKELRSAFIDGRGRLMELKKESSIEIKMREKGLKTSEVPPQKIKVKPQI
ncbi:S-adenosyl-methyltransferase [Bizionia gelidisalsuginis]|uniref:S-adenosyl-methyltransferase n=2 Tax=Bizionia TaxID=283785 RepID=A0A8H2LES6_9FLAO|nr:MULTISPECIES: FtsL-like putative cell division protein [Bizionia]TYB78082.1 S-adenosyl-methyltransferase [Bizionia saleffrena]TYC12140.1 S-adenosyl-methyltransferase [Bizionia gelidisalsuginis]